MTAVDTAPDPQPDEASASAKAPFPDARGRTKGYEKRAVDAFLARARKAFEAAEDEGPDAPSMTAAEVRGTAFSLTRHGYAIPAVDAALGRIEDAFAAHERGRAVKAAGAGEWVGRTRETAQVILDRFTRPRRRRFQRVSVLRYGYRIEEVDLVADKISRYLETGDSVTADQVRAVAFRMQRGGYREVQVDAALDAVVEVMLAVA